MHKLKRRGKLYTKFSFSIIDTVNLKRFTRIDSVDNGKTKFYVQLISTKFKIYRSFWIMKSKDRTFEVPERWCSNKHIYRDFNDGIDLRTMARPCQMIRQFSSITFSSPLGCSYLIRTKENIQKSTAYTEKEEY